MYATDLRHGDPTQPYVAMTQEEAQRVSDALHDAIPVYAWILTLPTTGRMPGVASLAGEHLRTLQELAATHDKAYNIPTNGS